MNISTKGIYAIEILLEIALNSKEDCKISLKEIAANRKLSEKYLERIVKELKKQNLIISTRGPKGGYSLGKNVDEIKVREVLESVEGELAPVECLVSKAKCDANCEKCPTRDVWHEMWMQILNVVEGVTIEDLVKKMKEIEEEDSQNLGLMHF